MNGEPARPNPIAQVEAKRIHISARQILESFKDRSDDYCLRVTLSLKPRHLRKIYDQLLRLGVLQEYERNHRERTSLEVEEKAVSRSTRSPMVSTTVSTFEAIGEFTTFPSASHSQRPSAPHVSPSASMAIVLEAAELCPKCNRNKHQDYPDSCPYCGVVFAKIRQSETSGPVTIWADGRRRYPGWRDLLSVLFR